MKVFPALTLICYLFLRIDGATVRSFPRYDYGGKTHQEFLQDAIERSSPGNARFLAELFGGLDLSLELGDGAQAVISVGGAATRCQHQSPCFDARCNSCYDPLLRIHGVCGGASYYTCRGTLPRKCLPRICTYRGKKNRSAMDDKEHHAVFVKKFSKHEDQFCLGLGDQDSKPRSLNLDGSDNSTKELDLSGSVANKTDDTPDWVMVVPDAVTACQSYDLCLDLRCGSCYDSYLGVHTSCGKMTYYDCTASLAPECQPMRCTETDINEIFPIGNHTIDDTKDKSPLMVRNFAPLEDKNCN